MKSNPEEVVSSLHMEAETFNLFVHQNYLNFFQDPQEVALSASYASDADLLGAQFQDNERMQEFSTSVFCRGMLFAKKEQTTAAHSPLSKPVWFQTHKAAKERQAQVDAFYTSYLEDFEASPSRTGSPMSRRNFVRDVVPTALSYWNSKLPRIPDFIRRHKDVVTNLSKYTPRTMRSIYSGGQPLPEAGITEDLGDKFDDDEVAPKPEPEESLRVKSDEPSTANEDATSTATTTPLVSAAEMRLPGLMEQKLYLADDDIED